jgi:alpha-tubulin suppressor-like RCC1 family protein
MQAHSNHSQSFTYVVQCHAIQQTIRLSRFHWACCNWQIHSMNRRTERSECYGHTSANRGVCRAAKRGKEKPVEEVPEPKQCLLISNCNKVACGAEFTMWLSDGKLYAAGSPQHGMLGDGSDHSCNVKDSSIKIMHEPIGIPQRVPHVSDVTNVACGSMHTVCCTSDGECYTWGSGDYGRLGHKVQQVRCW